MSFSSGVKDELSRHQTLARHCQIAEIAAIISMCGGVSISEKDHYSLKIQTENLSHLHGSTPPPYMYCFLLKMYPA